MMTLEEQIKNNREGFQRFVGQVEKWLKETEPKEATECGQAKKDEQAKRIYEN